MLGPDAQGAQPAQQPLQTLAGQHHRRPAIHRDLGGRAVADKQVAALPLRGDPGIAQQLQSPAHYGLVQRLGVAVFGLAFMGGLPMLRQQADHHLAAAAGLLQRLFPPLPGPDPGVQVQIQEDLLGQTRLLLDQPRLDRGRRPAVPAGMTQEHPGHERIVRQPKAFRPSSRLLLCAPVNTGVRTGDGYHRQRDFEHLDRGGAACSPSLMPTQSPRS